MKSIIPALALAGAAFLPGCANAPSGSTIAVDFNTALANVDQVLEQSCAAYDGLLPTAQSIQAIIVAADPALVVAGNAVATGENIGKQICIDLLTPPATSLVAGGARTDITIDNVKVVFVPKDSIKARKVF